MPTTLNVRTDVDPIIRNCVRLITAATSPLTSQVATTGEGMSPTYVISVMSILLIDTTGTRTKDRPGIEERNQDQQHYATGQRLIHQQLRRTDFDAVNRRCQHPPNRNLIQRRTAEGRHGETRPEQVTTHAGACRDGDAKTGDTDGAEFLQRDGLAEEEEVEEDYGRDGKDLGQLVEADRVECQAEITLGYLSGAVGDERCIMRQDTYENEEASEQDTDG